MPQPGRPQRIPRAGGGRPQRLDYRTEVARHRPQAGQLPLQRRIVGRQRHSPGDEAERRRGVAHTPLGQRRRLAQQAHAGGVVGRGLHPDFRQLQHARPIAPGLQCPGQGLDRGRPAAGHLQQRPGPGQRRLVGRADLQGPRITINRPPRVGQAVAEGVAQTHQPRAQPRPLMRARLAQQLGQIAPAVGPDVQRGQRLGDLLVRRRDGRIGVDERPLDLQPGVDGHRRLAQLVGLQIATRVRSARFSASVPTTVMRRRRPPPAPPTALPAPAAQPVHPAPTDRRDPPPAGG